MKRPLNLIYNKIIMKNNNMIAGCICWASLVAALTSCRKTEQQPNILFILADDQRADALGCAGNNLISTPNIDKLSETGLRFTNSYIMGGHHGAISAPSRAMLLSGRNLFSVYDKLEGVEIMPTYFSKFGYITFATGKWHNEKSAFEAGFQQGKSIFLGGMADHFNIAVGDLDNDGKLSEPQKKGFSTDIFTEAAIGFLERYATGDRKNPFFCYVAYTVPHDPYSPRPDYLDRYLPGSVPLPGNYMPLHPFAFDNLSVRDENLLPWPRPPESVKAVLADYYALISHLDNNVGEIVQTLKDNNLYKNTIIVYSADNGLAIGSHGLLGKQNLYEHSMKVPLIISGPGIPKGKRTDALVYLIDLFPTLAELVSLPLPENIDGISLLPAVQGKPDGGRSSIFTAYRNTIRAVRTKEWKLIRYPERDYSQLFNLMKDTLELNNLAQDERYKSTIEDLWQLMEDWQKTFGDTVSLTAKELLPLEYDHEKLERKPDMWQPEYTLKKYFGR